MDFTQPIVTPCLQSLLSCAAHASFRVKSATIAACETIVNRLWPAALPATMIRLRAICNLCCSHYHPYNRISG